MKSFQRARSIVEKLQKSGYTAYFTGGWVRDYLMNHPSNDIDIATNATVEQISQLFDKTISVGAHFGILVVVIEGEQFEVATFRKDVGYEDGRRPTSIEPATAQEDAQRRDFTINGLFYDPTTKTIHDYVEGQKDLKAGIIRAIGSPHHRFAEDRLRMIRAVRYSARFSFPIDYETQQAITNHALSLFPSVSIERIWQEFVKMAADPHFQIALCTLHRLGLLEQIFPSLSKTPLEILEKRLIPLSHFPKDIPVMVKLLQLFDPPVAEVIHQFKLSRQQIQQAELYLQFKAYLENPASLPYDFLPFYADPLCASFLAILLPGDTAKQTHHLSEQKRLSKAILRHQTRRYLLDVQKLLAAGIPQGPALSQLLKESEKFAVNQNIDDPEQLLSLILKKNKD